MRTTMKVRRLALVLGLALVGGTAGAQRSSDPGNRSTPNGEDPQIAAARARYDAAHWPAGPRRAGCDLERLTIAGLEGSRLEFSPAEGKVTRRYRDAGGGTVLLVELRVRESAEAAHRDLLEHIAFVQSVKLLPRTAERGIEAGDVGFVGHAGVRQDRIAWIAFVEGNVACRVLAFDPSADSPADVHGAAERLSESIRSGPSLSDDAPLPKPVIGHALALSASCRAGEAVVLDVAALEPSGRPAAVRFEVTGEGQGYVERDARGRIQLHTTAPGNVIVLVHACGNLGTFASAQIEVDVTRDGAPPPP